VATEKFLKQRALNIAVEGHYSLPNWYDSRGKLRTFACRTTRVSPYRMLVDVPVVGKVGDRLISYFHDFGKLDGHISDTKPGSFLLELDVTHVVREMLAKKLTWLEGKLKDPGISDLRQHRRLIPARSRSTLTLAEGAIYECFIIDMSVTGAAVSAEVQPAIGTPLAVGACVGRVVRVFASGFAVKFVERQDKLDLNRLIARPMPRSSTGGAKAASDSDSADVERMKAWSLGSD
jgi:PilZ domain